MKGVEYNKLIGNTTCVLCTQQLLKEKKYPPVLSALGKFNK